MSTHSGCPRNSRTSHDVPLSQDPEAPLLEDPISVRALASAFTGLKKDSRFPQPNHLGQKQVLHQCLTLHYS